MWNLIHRNINFATLAKPQSEDTKMEHEIIEALEQVKLRTIILETECEKLQDQSYKVQMLSEKIIKELDLIIARQKKEIDDRLVETYKHAVGE